MKRRVIYLIFSLLFGMHGLIFGQQSISGPTCVIKGITYQYDLQPKWDGSSEMTLCIRGGTIENTPSDCIKTVSLPYIRVVWDDGIDQGIIYYSYGEKKDSIGVFVTQPLSAGAPETEKKIQRLTSHATPQQINCSASTGGNCSPDYRYQWQSSLDGESWEDITGAKDQNMSFKSTPDKTTFYRRKTTENKSGAIAYSAISIIVLEPADMRAWNQ